MHTIRKRSVLTDMHIGMDYERVDAESPDHIVPTHDGMVITLPG